MNKIKLFWDQKSDLWKHISLDLHSYYRCRTYTVLDLISRYLDTGKALDVGCGVGLLSLELAKRGFDSYGTDISENMIEKAIETMSSIMNHPENHFRVFIEGKRPFDFKFDIITAIGVFPYVENYEEYLEFLSQLLSDNGYIIASCTKNVSLYTIYLILDHIKQFHYSKEWRHIFMNLIRTGVWSGGYINYNTANQCYDSSSFDNLFYRHGYYMVDNIDLFNVSVFDKNSLNRKGLNKWFARYLGWNHIGVYKKQ